MSLSNKAYELLVLPTQWIFNADPESLQNLTVLINRAYNKIKFKYDIIIIDRVEDHTTFARDFFLQPGANMYVYLLLGPKETFDELRAEGYSRNFSVPFESLTHEECFASDIPEKYVSFFEFTKDLDLKINVAANDYKLTKDDLNRTLATLGIKGVKEEPPTQKNLEITAYTSYLKHAGKKLLDIVIERCFLDPELFKNHSDLPLSSFEKIVIVADYIKEHNLERFYTIAGFKQSARDNYVIPGGPAGDLFGRGPIAKSNFTVVSYEREVLLK